MKEEEEEDVFEMRWKTIIVALHMRRTLEGRNGVVLLRETKPDQYCIHAHIIVTSLHISGQLLRQYIIMLPFCC